MLLKTVDTLVWINSTSPRAGFEAYNFYMQEPFGSWILFGEIVLFGLLPALLLLNGQLRAKPAVAHRRGGAGLLRHHTEPLRAHHPDTGASHSVLRRVYVVLAELAGSGAFLAVVAYGVILYSFSFRYLTLFPQERELPQQ